MIRSKKGDNHSTIRTPNRRQNVLHNISNVITKIPSLNNEVKKSVPISARVLLSTPWLNDSTKITILKKFDPVKAEKLQKILDTSNHVLDVTEKVDKFHTDLTKKIPESKKAYVEFKNNNRLGGKSKKNKQIKSKKRNKTNKRNKNKIDYTRI